MTPRWHILGAGAMGCLFAGALQRTGVHVTLILRETNATQVPVVITEGADRQEHLLDAVDATNCDHIDHLLISTKAYDAVDAVDSVRGALTQDSTLLLMVNGMGLVEQLRETLPGQIIACGTSTEGAYTTGLREVQHAGRGTTRIGLQGEASAPGWFAPWEAALQDCDWEQDIESALWAKLAVNCVINPLTALHRCRNGELAQSGYAQDIAQLCQEVRQVSEACGHKHTAQMIEETVAQVIAGTADNQSSMLQDLLRGRPTEIDFINGYLITVADTLGIDVPLNKALLAEVKALA